MKANQKTLEVREIEYREPVEYLGPECSLLFTMCMVAKLAIDGRVYDYVAHFEKDEYDAHPDNVKGRFREAAEKAFASLVEKLNKEESE